MKAILQTFRDKYSPLNQLLILGFFVRLFSVIFSKGFGWHDDHFLIIESSQSWADDYDYNNWLPAEGDNTRTPQGHSLFYIGIHYYIFKFFKLIGIADPQLKMVFIRLLHAMWSLLVIKYSYKLTELYSNKRIAWYVGIFTAFYWFMPFMSVRNLVEFVCVPPVLIAIYLLSKPMLTSRNVLIAGLWLGIAFSIRFQTVFISAGIGLALLIMRTSLKNILLLALSFLTVVALSQGVVDYCIWKKPFAEFLSYVQYNVDNAGVYGTDNWHMYFDLIFGLLIPPLSFLLFAGYIVSGKKIPLIFWPVFFYLAFHTYFPNKQERFIMTVLPLIIISGTIGMFMIYEKRKEKINIRLFKFCKIFVIVLNLILLPILTLSYSKRHRVESMTYLYHKNDSNSFMVEDSNKENDFLMPPLFYYGKWFSVLGMSKSFNADSALYYYNRIEVKQRPNYVIFMQAENIAARVDSLKKRFPTLVYETTIEPSLIDKTLFFLNPLNDNQTAFIYKIK
ncbi:MAG: glycosyltransferase family 39 protein [Bacteroidetes bacterium]|nr:glycosyltransferase family 39 protein [Bacteroidota bacterium]